LLGRAPLETSGEQPAITARSARKPAVNGAKQREIRRLINRPFLLCSAALTGPRVDAQHLAETLVELDAIGDGRLNAEIAVVISNEPAAGGLERARQAGIEAITIDHRGWSSRDAFDRELARELTSRGVRLVCLAGFLRVIGSPLLDAFPDAILNIHPSLLPAFPGLDAQGQAIEHGVKISGVTVHLVDAGLDAGPIVWQRAVPIRDDDTADTLAARILIEEHRIYPEAVQLVLDGGWRVEGRRFVRELQRA
jgi:phosphoribosylglycinamide formyltransferase-1